VPPRRKKAAPAALAKRPSEADAPDAATEQEDLPLVASTSRTEGAVLRSQPALVDAPSPQAEEPASELPPDPPAPEPEVEEGPVHRPLIRATLPRVEGQVPVRQLPDFTLRLPGARLGPLRENDRGPRNGRPGPGGQVGRPAGKPPRGTGKPGRPGKPGRGPKPAMTTHPSSQANAPGGKPRGHRPRHGGGKKRQR
jgi:hypothetical protein